MDKRVIGKGLLIALLGLGAFGLLAGQRSSEVTIDIAFPTQHATPNEGQGGATSPRECDLQRGIDTGCTFL